MDTSPSPSVRNKRVMEALILALGSSEISRIVNVGTLRYFIEFTFRDMLNGTSFDLAPLWNTLSAEPGLTPEMIYPPLLQFREWQERMGIAVALPKAMAELPSGDLDGYLARIQVKQADLDRIFQEAAPVRPADSPAGRFIPTAAAPKSAVPQRVAPRLSEKYLNPSAQSARKDEGDNEPDRYARGGQPAGPGALTRHRVPIMIVCGVIALAAFGYAGSRLFGHHGSITSLARVQGILKLDQARRVDYVVTAVVVDPRWDAMPRDERRKAVDEIFRTLEAEGVKSLILRGPRGESRAMASTVGGERKISVE